MLNKLALFFSHSIFQKLMSFVIMSLILNALSKEDYAIFNLFYNFVYILTSILIFETNRVFQTNISLNKESEKKIISQFILILILSFTFIASLITAWKFFLSDIIYLSLKNIPLIYFLIFSLVIINYKFFISFYTGKQDFRKMCFVSIFFPGLTIFSVLFFYIFDFNFLTMYFYINLITLLSYQIFFRSIIFFDFKNLAKTFLYFSNYLKKSIYYFFIGFKDHFFVLIIFAYISHIDVVVIADIGFLLFFSQFIQLGNLSLINIFLNKGNLSSREKYLLFPTLILGGFIMIFLVYSNSWLINLFYEKYLNTFLDNILLAFSFAIVSGTLGLLSVTVEKNKLKNILVNLVLYILSAIFIFFLITDEFSIIKKFFLYLIISNSLVILYLVLTNQLLKKYINKTKINLTFYTFICLSPIFTNNLKFYLFLFVLFLFLNKKLVLFFIYDFLKFFKRRFL